MPGPERPFGGGITTIDASPPPNPFGPGGHRTVLAAEAVAGLSVAPGGIYVDATFGGGGHSRAVVEQLHPPGRLLALDRDPEAIRRGEGLLAEFLSDGSGSPSAGRLTLIHAPFSRLAAVLADEGIKEVHGVLFDLGVSSRQLDEPQRGFSFRSDGPLDMRMNPESGSATAAHLVNTLDAEALADIFSRYGEERHGRRVARAIVNDRQRQPFTGTRQLAGLLERIIPGKRGAIHPATRVFQALRIAVNQEMAELEAGLEAALAFLRPGGRIVAISFHSLEDRVVKNSFRRAAGFQPPPDGPAALLPTPAAAAAGFRLLTRKPVVPQAAEIQDNPRARSAKMRIIERILPTGPDRRREQAS